MTRLHRPFGFIGLALWSCAGAAERPTSLEEPAPPEEMSSHGAPQIVDEQCIPPLAMEPLDVCRAGGVDEERAPLTEATATDLWARAYTAWRENRWVECAELFAELSELHPELRVRAEAAYTSAICYNNHFQTLMDDMDSAASARPRVGRRGRGKRRLTHEEQEQQELQRLRPRALTPLEISMELAYARVLCLSPEQEDLVPIKYRRARIHYAANHWGVAATLFRDIVDHHADHELAVFSANLYLDCINLIPRLEPQRRTVCRDLLTTEVERLLSSQELTRDEALRQMLSQLQCGIFWRQAEGLTEADRFREAGALYLRIYSDYRDECRQVGSHDLCEVLYNAAINYEADYCIDAALQIRRRLFHECGENSQYAQDHLQSSTWATRSVYQTAGNLHALGHYEKAAQRYEEFARLYPGEEDAPEALRAALGLRLGLGHDDQVQTNAGLFEKNYGRRREFKRDTASVVFAVGAMYTQKKAWGDTISHYESFLRRYGSVARNDEKIRASIEIGMARREMGGIESSRGQDDLRRALKLSQSSASTKTIDDEAAHYRSLIGDEPGHDEAHYKARLVLLVDAVSRAREALGGDAPERALIQKLGMSPAQAVKTLNFIVPPDDQELFEQCKIQLPEIQD